MKCPLHSSSQTVPSSRTDRARPPCLVEFAQNFPSRLVRHFLFNFFVWAQSCGRSLRSEPNQNEREFKDTPVVSPAGKPHHPHEINTQPFSQRMLPHNVPYCLFFYASRAMGSTSEIHRRQKGKTPSYTLTKRPSSRQSFSQS